MGSEDNRQDALALVLVRNEFYKRLYRLVVAAWVLAVVVIGVLTWALIYLMRVEVKPLYFAADKAGRLIQMVPDDVPNMSMQAVIAWTTEAIEAAFSYDYINYHAELQNAEKYFTHYGWSKYMGALAATNNLLALNDRKMIVLAQVVSPPRVVAQGILGGSFAWKFEVPLLVTYWLPPYNDQSKFPNPLQLTVVVQRQPLLQSYKGLGIAQVIGTFASNPSLGISPPISGTAT